MVGMAQTKTILIVSPKLITYIGGNKGLLPFLAINPNLMQGETHKNNLA